MATAVTAATVLAAVLLDKLAQVVQLAVQELLVQVDQLASAVVQAAAAAQVMVALVVWVQTVVVVVIQGPAV